MRSRQDYAGVDHDTISLIIIRQVICLFCVVFCTVWFKGVQQSVSFLEAGQLDPQDVDLYHVSLPSCHTPATIAVLTGQDLNFRGSL